MREAFRRRQRRRCRAKSTGSKFLIPSFWFLVDDWPYGFRETRNEKLETVFGRSTNGRSSAFGALCLGSNPSRPAKRFVVQRSCCYSIRQGRPEFRSVYDPD